MTNIGQIKFTEQMSDSLVICFCISVVILPSSGDNLNVKENSPMRMWIFTGWEYRGPLAYILQ